MSERQHTILLVEDDDLLRDSFSLLLNYAGYRASTAGTAREALEQIRANRPDVVILDLGLPDRPGLEVVLDVRADPEVKDTPLLVLTGRVGAREEREARAAGCDRFLGKPVAPTVLLQEIAELLEG